MKTINPQPVIAVDTHPSLAQAAAKLFYFAATGVDSAVFLTQSLPLVCQALEGEYLALVDGQKGVWRVLGASNPHGSLPIDLLAESLDADAPVQRGDWYVAPLNPRSGSGEMLCALRTWNQDLERHGTLETTRLWLAEGLAQVRAREHDRKRTQRLQAILEIAARWQQTQEMVPLLTEMAETATRLLGAERASIFLWDKSNKLLVGRPALGVPGNELRIADSTGVVGQVVQTGLARRVDADIEAEQREVDRRVDKQTKFQTRSIVCVPLLGKPARGPRAATGQIFGAFEVLNKIGGNFTADDEEALTELAMHAAVALENTQQMEQLVSARKQIADEAAQGVQLIGTSPAIEALRGTVRRVADTDLAVLILGENGTGKEVVSQLIHYQSRRRQEPFVAVNCAAITETLLESELFGHEKGAFTDARETRQGKFELASGGTLLLDEIGDMSLGGQAKLLRVLEEKVVVRVGGSMAIPTDTRVLAATNQNLAELVRAKRFREDLFYRLSVVTLDLPPLRSRGEDVELLAEHFLRFFSAKARRKAPQFTAAARKRLLAHSWPGNVRELRNLMERLAYLSPEDQDKIDSPDLAFIMSPSAGAASILSLDEPLTEATQRFQVEYIKKQIETCRGNMTLAAEKLGLHRSNLYRKMGQLGMETGEG